MAEATLRFLIRTPRRVILECDAASVRVPTETGQVGVRPRGEASVLAVDPGLIVVRQDGLTRFAGTAGGLLRCEGAAASLLTPVAVVGDALTTVLEELDRALAAPSAEQETRAMLGRLEKNMLQFLQHGDAERVHTAGRE
jgi:F0F1-type ATP synthase epsilon subunit